MELDAIADKYEYEQKLTGVKIILISVDSALPSSGKVIKFVRSKGWRYEVYLDPMGDFQKAMKVMDTPATYIVNGKGNVVWNHNSYAEGDENKLFEELNKIAAIK
jgi:cytochrome c biogenesis protein CcmG, thiol:disulfide interchange protein DsbE